ncbi:MAG TPA: hypothetical protein VEF71_26835 [Streptosporangiaceae bacterium]|nr:hypothetical protein [Streptosporangiaceae bacterium]
MSRVSSSPWSSAAVNQATCQTSLPSAAGDPTASQRRQLDDQADLVAAVMEAAATLTVGNVPVGPHA